MKWLGEKAWHLLLAIAGKPCPYKLIRWRSGGNADDHDDSMQQGNCTVCGAVHASSLIFYGRGFAVRSN
jgi:hypothetical protein